MAYSVPKRTGKLTLASPLGPFTPAGCLKSAARSHGGPAGGRSHGLPGSALGMRP